MKRCTLLLVLFVWFELLNGQTTDGYVKGMDQENEDIESYQKNGERELENEYTAFQTKEDSIWMDFLKKEWTAYDITIKKRPLVIPKPKEAPIYELPTNPVPSREIETSAKLKQELPIKDTSQNENRTELKSKIILNQSNLDTALLNFYGCDITIPFDKKLSKCRLSEISETGISKFWNDMNECNYLPLVKCLKEYRTRFQLNDYGYFQLAKLLSEQLYKPTTNESRLQNWFLMIRSGYGARVGFKNDTIVILLPIKQQLYSHIFMSLDNKKYYLFPEVSGKNINTYSKDLSTSTQSIDMNIQQPMDFKGRKEEKIVSMDFEGKTYQLKIAYNPDLIEYYKTYPQTELGVYFNASPSKIATESLISSLKIYTEKMSEEQSLNFLLHLVQTTFKYKNDIDQFGFEKSFFAEEVFYYPFSDCEDRAVLFSYLVRSLTKMEVIGLYYPNHVATAVAVNTNIKGDYVKYKDITYIIADPTYVNANVGIPMPNYKSIAPEVILIRK
jgi:hypothetical protein